MSDHSWSSIPPIVGEALRYLDAAARRHAFALREITTRMATAEEVLRALESAQAMHQRRVDTELSRLWDAVLSGDPTSTTPSGVHADRSVDLVSDAVRSALGPLYESLASRVAALEGAKDTPSSCDLSISSPKKLTAEQNFDELRSSIFRFEQDVVALVDAVDAMRQEIRALKTERPAVAPCLRGDQAESPRVRWADHTGGSGFLFQWQRQRTRTMRLVDRKRGVSEWAIPWIPTRSSSFCAGNVRVVVFRDVLTHPCHGLSSECASPVLEVKNAAADSVAFRVSVAVLLRQRLRVDVRPPSLGLVVDDRLVLLPTRFSDELTASVDTRSRSVTPRRHTPPHHATDGLRRSLSAARTYVAPATLVSGKCNETSVACVGHALWIPSGARVSVVLVGGVGANEAVEAWLEMHPIE